MRKIVVLLFILISGISYSFSQDYINALQVRLDSLSKRLPALDKPVSISVSSAPVKEFLRGIARTNNLNLEIDESLNFPVSSDFSDVKVKDVLLLLCKRHNLHLDFVGDIIAIRQRQEPPVVKEIDISYRKKLLSGSLSGDDLMEVCQKITELSGENIVVLRGSEHERVSGNFKDMPVANALELIAAGNQLDLQKSPNGYYILEKTARPQNMQNGWNKYKNKDKPAGDILNKTIALQNRTIDSLIHLLPKDVKEKLEIKEFADLNSLIVSGNEAEIDKLETFLKHLDRSVPLILIELMIVEVNNSANISTGLEMGIGESANVSGGSLHPNLEYNLSTRAINNLFSNIGSFTATNLGPVNPNFYLKIKALEDNGALEVKSTPRLSTLNGHVAEMASGEKKYYYEEQTNIYSTQSTLQNTNRIWKEITADLKVKIRPLVAGDNQITLNIEVEQSDFTPRESADAPPGTATRSFRSLIRVKNQEMVLLGGLERNENSTTGRGLPWISRVPILGWFFGNKTKSRVRRKLNIFIRPTVIN